MAILPLIPLDEAKAGAPGTGLISAEALNTPTGPDAWKPDPEKTRPTSFPTPFSLHDATEFLISKKAKSETLVAGSMMLLRGLVSGLLRFRWIDLVEMRSEGFRFALEEFLKDDPHQRLGLITYAPEPGGKEQTWGYMLDKGIPVLAGARHGDMEKLKRILEAADIDKGKHKRLLEMIRDSLKGLDKWSSDNISWMRLFDMTIDDIGASEQVAVESDVRSVGPFFVPVVGDPGAEMPIYLLSYSKGFVNRLARFLGGVVRLPGEHGGDPQRLQLLAGGKPVATFRYPRKLEEGLGVADFVEDKIPSGCPEIDSLASSKLLDNEFLNHLKEIRPHVDRWTEKKANAEAVPLDEVLEKRPYLLSDVARAVAQFVPEKIDENVRAVAFSPAFKAAMRSAKMNPHLGRSEIDQLEEQRQACLLPASAGRKRDCVFVEEVRSGDGRTAIAVGDLSTIGLGLWTVFTRERDDDYRERMGYLDRSGDSVFDSALEEWPLDVSQTVRKAWEEKTGNTQTALRLATLQRFLASYEAIASGGDSVAKLCSLAARAFARRALMVENEAIDALLAPRAGRAVTAVSDKERPIDLAGTGPMRILRDPFVL